MSAPFAARLSAPEPEAALLFALLHQTQARVATPLVLPDYRRLDYGDLLHLRVVRLPGDPLPSLGSLHDAGASRLAPRRDSRPLPGENRTSAGTLDGPGRGEKRDVLDERRRPPAGLVASAAPLRSQKGTATNSTRWAETASREASGRTRPCTRENSKSSGTSVTGSRSGSSSRNPTRTG